MTGVHDLGWFVMAGLLLNLTPGPDMAYIAARSAAGGVRDGVAATLGITLGCIVHTLAAAVGLSALIAASATAFTVVKLLGAAYLAYAGVRLLIAASRAPVGGNAPSHAAAPRTCGVHRARGVPHQRAQSEGRAVLPRVPAAVHRVGRAAPGACCSSRSAACST